MKDRGGQKPETGELSSALDVGNTRSSVTGLSNRNHCAQASSSNAPPLAIPSCHPTSSINSGRLRGLPPASLNLIALLIEIAETPLPRASWHLAVLAPPILRGPKSMGWNLETHLASCTSHHPLVIFASRSSEEPRLLSGWPQESLESYFGLPSLLTVSINHPSLPAQSRVAKHSHTPH